MYKKLLLSFFIVLLVLISFLGTLDKSSSLELDKSFTRSVTVFAIARGLNGLISVVQGTEIYATPAGVGVNFAVGQIVDPMNDMVERFSFVMLMSSVSLGIQEIMLEISDENVFKFLLLFFGVLLISMIYIDKLRQKNIFNIVFKSFVILAFLRFLVPLVVLSNELVYEYILEPKYEESRAALIFSSSQIKEIVTEVEVNTKKRQIVYTKIEKTTLAKVQNYFAQTVDSLNISKQLDTLKSGLKKLLNDLDDKFEHSINYILVLITIFIVQSILLPLFSLWLFIKLFRAFLKKEIII